MATLKGDVRLGNYTLRMDFNALCDAEEDFPGIMNGEVDIGSPRKIRTMIRHALAAHHADLSDREVGDIISAEGVEASASALAEAMRASFPAASEASDNANPQKAPAKGSTSKAR